jgi:hypothetical protein
MEKLTKEQEERIFNSTMMSNQETLEQAAKRLYPDDGYKDEVYCDIGGYNRELFTEGAKWQQEISYSDAIEFGKWLDDNAQQREYYPMSAMTMEELFEQHKKK